MAATCLDIITFAMRQCKILGLGKTPKDAEAEEGLSALQSLYDQWRTGGMFGRLRDVYLTSDATAQEGRRYYVPAGVTLTDATNDYVPQYGAAPYGDYGMSDETPYDYAGDVGVTRQPRDLALYESLTSTGLQTAKLYDRTEWVDLLDLELSDAAPLSGRGARGLAACLATSAGFADVFGAEPGPGTVALARHFLRNVTSKVGSTRDGCAADYY